MALKRKISADDHAKLAAHFQSEYKKVGDNFVLDTEDNDDMAEVRLVAEREKAASKAATKRAAEAEAAATAAREELEAAKLDSANVGKTELEKLQAKHDAALAKVNKEAEAKLSTVSGQLNAILIDGEADKIGASLFKFTPGVFTAQLIKPRLRVGEKDGKPITTAVDAAGNEMTLDALRQEVLANKDFADILKPINQSTGGGAPVIPGNGQGGGGAKTLTEQHAEEAQRQGLAKPY